MYKFLHVNLNVPVNNCQTPVQVLGLGVDFVLPLSQLQQEQPTQDIPQGGCTRGLKFGTQTKGRGEKKS